MKIRKLIISILSALIGIFVFVYGGYDDRPGAQMLGLVLVIVSVVRIVKRKKQMKNNDYHSLLLKSLPVSYQIWFEEERKYLERYITPDSNVLEVGSGDGRSIFDLLPITKNIIGIDHDKNAVDESSRRFSEYKTIRFVEAEAQKLPFEDESFDYVICMTSFVNFAENKIPALKEMKRVVKNTGRIILSVFSQNALPERLKVYKNVNAPIKEIKGGTVVFGEELGDNISEQFTKEELLNLFNQADLTVQDITEVNMAYLCCLNKN